VCSQRVGDGTGSLLCPLGDPYTRISGVRIYVNRALCSFCHTVSNGHSYNIIKINKTFYVYNYIQNNLFRQELFKHTVKDPKG
jgi:hypothetical protein